MGRLLLPGGEGSGETEHDLPDSVHRQGEGARGHPSSDFVEQQVAPCRERQRGRNVLALTG